MERPWRWSSVKHGRNVGVGEGRQLPRAGFFSPKSGDQTMNVFCGRSGKVCGTRACLGKYLREYIIYIWTFAPLFAHEAE